MGIDFITIAALLPSCCGFFVFGCRVSFLVGSSIFFVNRCSVVSCDFGVLVRRGELTSFYSTILFGMDMHTLLFLKSVTNKDLLYSTGNSTQHSVIT